jgi:hypothetical protein
VRDAEEVVDVDDRLVVRIAELVGTKPGSHTTLPPRVLGRRPWSVNTCASVNATTGESVLHVHGSADLIVDGFPCCEQGDHMLEPAQVTSPTHGESNHSSQARGQLWIPSMVAIDFAYRLVFRASADSSRLHSPDHCSPLGR